MLTFKKFIYVFLIMPMSFAGFSKTMKVKILNNRFDPAAISVCEGDTISWSNLSGNAMELVTGSHCKADGVLKSGSIMDGNEFLYVFNKQGNYTYFMPAMCSNGMKGLVMVNPRKIESGKAKIYEQSQAKKSSSFKMSDDVVLKTKKLKWNSINKQIFAIKPKELMA